MFFGNDLFLLGWTAVLALLSYGLKIKRPETVLGRQEERTPLIFAVIGFLPIFWFVAMGPIRSDVFQYLTGFDNLKTTVGDVFRTWDFNKHGQGFTILQVLIKDFFGNSRSAFRIVIALIQSIPLVLIYRKYSEDYAFSIFLFVCMGLYDGWMMNGLRQFVAVCIIFAATPLLLKRKYVPTLIVIFIAFTIHQSAIMMLPVVFMVMFKPWSKKSLFLMTAFSVVLYFYVENSNMISEEILATDNGSNPLRILISAFPLILAFIARKKIEEDNNVLINVCVNMSFLTSLIYLIATLTSGIMTGRLPIYTNLYNLILIPYLCNKVFDKDKSQLIMLGFCVFYLAYFFI